MDTKEYERRRIFLDSLKKLHTSEYIDIVKILKLQKVEYSENSNGIFFDLLSISENTFLEIREYINFCLKTRQEHEVRLKELEDIRSENEKYVAEN